MSEPKASHKKIYFDIFGYSEDERIGLERKLILFMKNFTLTSGRGRVTYRKVESAEVK